MCPCAMLMTRITPKVMASPRAVSIRMELRLRLLERAALRSVREFILAYFVGALETGPGVRTPPGPACYCGRSRHLGDLDLDVLALGFPALGPVALPPGEGDLRERVGFDRL